MNRLPMNERRANVPDPACLKRPLKDIDDVSFSLMNGTCSDLAGRCWRTTGQVSSFKVEIPPDKKNSTHMLPDCDVIAGAVSFLKFNYIHY